MTKVKFTEKPTYEEVELIGKTFDSITGTIDRKSISRSLITEAAGFEDKHIVVNGDESTIKSVEKIGDDGVELFVELVGGIKSLASKKLYKGWTAKNKENGDVVDVYVDAMGEEVSKAKGLVDIATRMCAAHPECDNQWAIVRKDGGRVFIRLVDTEIDGRGKRINA